MRDFYHFFLPEQTPIKGPIHNYDPHNFDDMYADEYGGYGTGMNTGNFRNGSGGNTAGRFGNDRGLFTKFTHRSRISISNSAAGSGNGGGGGNRGFSERGGNRSFSDRGGRGGGNGNGNMDRRSGGNATGNNGGGGMRDYVDPWAHNGNNNGSSPMMGGMNNFASNNMNMASLTTVNPSGQNNGGNNFGNSMDVDKTSTQVTIPKDVS